jgi:hypothetical protein
MVQLFGTSLKWITPSKFHQTHSIALLTYLIWPQVSPLDQDQTIDFVCQDLK